MPNITFTIGDKPFSLTPEQVRFPLSCRLWSIQFEVSLLPSILYFYISKVTYLFSVYSENWRRHCSSLHQWVHGFGCAASTWSSMVCYLSPHFIASVYIYTFLFRCFCLSLSWKCMIAGFLVMYSWERIIPSSTMVTWKLVLQKLLSDSLAMLLKCFDQMFLWHCCRVLSNEIACKCPCCFRHIRTMLW